MKYIWIPEFKKYYACLPICITTHVLIPTAYIADMISDSRKDR
jgi:hypothetical protein